MLRPTLWTLLFLVQRSGNICGIWAIFLVLPRTFNPLTGKYGSLYSDLLDYVISAALIFYILT
ncbi:MAG: hypothetical protein WA708_01665, partial [Acidobacteriaceae bacterium]